MRVRNYAAMLTAAALALAACGGSSDTSSTDNPTASAEASTPAVAGAPEASSAATPDTTPTAEPTPEPEPTPTGPTPITSDDLIDVLPRPGQVSNIQDRKFKRSLDEYADEPGADWAADAPLTSEQRDQINLGDLRKTKPAICQYAAFLDGGWMTSEWASADYITAAARSSMKQDVTSSNVRQKDLVVDFSTIIYVMPPGEADIWLTNGVNTLKKCARHKMVDSTGKITNVRLAPGKLRTNQSAYLWDHSVDYRGTDITFIDVWEVIGNALLVVRIGAFNQTDASRQRAVKVYNNMADKLANAQDVTREPLVLDELTNVKQDPAKVQDPTRPASSLT